MGAATCSSDPYPMDPDHGLPMYRKSTRFYDALYGFKDYDLATGRLVQIIDEHHPAARSLLDVACGTGKHLERLQPRFHVEGLDISEEMLAIARSRCPEVPLHRADMADFHLARRFDVVCCLFSSIAYVRTIDRMRQAVASMARHLEPGGLLVLEPWFTPHQYWTGTITANHVDQPDLKITWMYTSRRVDALSVLDIHYLVGTPERVEHFTERHELGLFTDDEYLDAFRAAGLEATHDPQGLFGRGMYLGIAPREAGVVGA